jgi:hypothetical protein
MQRVHDVCATFMGCSVTLEPLRLTHTLATSKSDVIPYMQSVGSSSRLVM